MHLDIKLDNVLISRENEVVLIDFGQARKYLQPDGSHCPETGEAEWGNIHFASLNAFKKQTLSRRDDVIQVIYSLMCLYNQFLPLREYLGRDTEDFDLFRIFKTEETAKEFCEVADCEFLREALEESYATEYDQDPDYSKIKFLLQKALLEERIVPGGRYYQKKPIGPNNLNSEQIPEIFEIPEEEAVVTLNASRVNPLNIKANLDWKL